MNQGLAEQVVPAACGLWSHGTARRGVLNLTPRSSLIGLAILNCLRYGKSSSSSGQVQLLKDLDAGIEGRDVVIVEDIVDTGLTLTYMQDILRARSPRTLRTACLLSKPSRRQIEVSVEYVGFSIEDTFVVGYGLDYAEQYRNLPYIAILDTDAGAG